MSISASYWILVSIIAIFIYIVYKADWMWCIKTREWIERFIFGRRWF
jgi:hypothetical protein